MKIFFTWKRSLVDSRWEPVILYERPQASGVDGKESQPIYAPLNEIETKSRFLTDEMFIGWMNEFPAPVLKEESNETKNN